MVVYPVDGRLARCPVTKRPVPAEGLTVSEHDTYWARRLRDGDVTETAPEPADEGAGDTPPAKPENTGAANEAAEEGAH